MLTWPMLEGQKAAGPARSAHAAARGFLRAGSLSALAACCTVSCVPMPPIPPDCPITDCPFVESTETGLLVNVDDAFFGLSISTSGDLMGVGSSGDDHAGPFSGAAYIFRREGGTWVPEAKLTAADAAPQDYFGTISINGDRAVVGAPTCFCEQGRPAGAAYVFRRDGQQWTQEARLTVDDAEQPNDFFGGAVSISGDRLVVGARFDFHDGADSGAAYVFRREGALWRREAKLVSDGGGSDDFGFTVAMDGDFIAVGAVCDDVADAPGFCVGSVYLFERTGTEWTQRAKLSASDAGDRDYFGASLCLNGDDLIVGADRAAGSGTGRAYIFRRNGAIWSQQAVLEPDVDGAGGSFGSSVAIDGGTSLVGGVFADGGPDGEYRGAIYVFQRDGGQWRRATKIYAADRTEGQLFGKSAALNGNVAAAGVIMADGESGPGGMHVLDLCNLNCSP